MLTDAKGKLWLHDVATKNLFCYDPDLKRLAAIPGHSIALYFQDDVVFVGQNKKMLVWHMGRQSLGVVDTDSMTMIRKISKFTTNWVVRKMVGLTKKPHVILLEVLDTDNKSQTHIHCYDVEKQERVFMGKCVEDINSDSQKDSQVFRFTKSIELSQDEETLFSVGVYIDGLPDKPNQKGFINAMKLNETLTETRVELVESASHPDKKGLYRVSRCADEDTLIVGGWVDVFIYGYAQNQFTFMYSFQKIHSAFIYNVIAFDRCFFTCSNDCEATLIEF